MNRPSISSRSALGLILPLLAFLAVGSGAEHGLAAGDLSDAVAAPGDQFGVDEWRHGSRLTGDWGSLRPRSETVGFAWQGSHIADASSVVRGGLGNREIVRGLLDLNLTLDASTAWGGDGGTLFAQYLVRHGSNGSSVVGDLQGFSNIDADRFSALGELWYEQVLLDGRLRAKIGQVDANAEFGAVAAAGEFINSSAGVSPTLFGLPTYPEAAVGVNLFFHPADWLCLGAGAYADNLRSLSSAGFRRPYLLGEIGITPQGAGVSGAGRFAAGFWHDTDAVARLDGRTKKGATGVYALYEQHIWKLNRGGMTDRSVSLFAQYGSADPQVSVVEQHLGVGLSCDGLLAGRADDTAGVYWSRVRTSRVAREGTDDDESCVELFYGFWLTPFFSLKADLQRLSHPGGHATPAAAWIATVRTTVLF